MLKCPVEFTTCKPGVYQINWKSGGFSIAAVGVMPNGSRWLAPLNWVMPGTISNVIEDIDSMEFILNRVNYGVDDVG